MYGVRTTYGNANSYLINYFICNQFFFGPETIQLSVLGRYGILGMIFMVMVGMIWLRRWGDNYGLEAQWPVTFKDYETIEKVTYIGRNLSSWLILMLLFLSARSDLPYNDNRCRHHWCFSSTSSSSWRPAAALVQGFECSRVSQSSSSRARVCLAICRKIVFLPFGGLCS